MLAALQWSAGTEVDFGAQTRVLAAWTGRRHRPPEQFSFTRSPSRSHAPWLPDCSEHLTPDVAGGFRSPSVSLSSTRCAVMPWAFATSPGWAFNCWALLLW